MILKTFLALKSSIKISSSLRYALVIFIMASVFVPPLSLMAQPEWLPANSGGMSALFRLSLIVEAHTSALASIFKPNSIAPPSVMETLQPASTVKHVAGLNAEPALVASHDETFVPEAPTRLLIAAIDLDAPVVPVGFSTVEVDGKIVTRWDVPDWAAAGWLKTSARAGAVGNTVLAGHQNIYGRIFRNLEYLKPGDTIQVIAGDQIRNYHVSQMEILPEKDQPIEVRRANAQWIAPTDDERLTLVTCWPRNSNTHRLIIVALPDDTPPTAP